MAASADLRARIGTLCLDEIADWALRLVRAPSPNPPLETRVVAEEAAILRAAVPRADLSLHDAGSGVINLVAHVQGARPGRRVVFNGQLDTYPVGDRSLWTRDPAGAIEGDCLYGRGAADMKGGIAASIGTLAALAGPGMPGPARPY